MDPLKVKASLDRVLSFAQAVLSLGHPYLPDRAAAVALEDLAALRQITQNTDAVQAAVDTINGTKRQ